MRAEEARKRLRDAFTRGRMGHALLIAGAPRGAAGDTARWLLKLVMCLAPPGAERPCGACRACRQIENRSWPDVDWVEPEMKSRQIGVKRIRALCLRMGRTSLSGGWKAAVLVHAERMGAAGANAFLKTLEEPPPETLLLLLCENPGLLPDTIVSRCRRLEIREPETASAPEPWQAELLELLAGIRGGNRAAGGIVRMAAATQIKELLDGVKEEITRAEKTRASRDAEEGLEESAEVLAARVESRYRETLEKFLAIMQQWNRDVLIHKSGGTPDLLFFPDRAEATRARADGLSLARALANVDGIEILRRRLDRNLSENTVFMDGLDSLYA